MLTGNRVSPYLIAGIHPNEVDSGIVIGGCSFYETGETAVRESTNKDKKTKFAKEKDAFGKIIADIRKNPKWRTIPRTHPRVSCRGGEIGYFQIRPTAWLYYRDSVLEALNIKTASPYELIPSIVAANLILRDKMRHLRLRETMVTLNNSLYFAKVAGAYNAGAEGVSDYIPRYGEDVYVAAMNLQKRIAKRERARKNTSFARAD